MAAEGQNKVASSLVDMQPTAILELFQIYPDRINKPSLFLGFHGGSIYDKSVTWQGVQYLPLAIESEGFDVLGDGKLPRPKIRIANQNNLITNFLQNYKDLIHAKVIRKKVQVKFIDDVNFEGGNPFGVADPQAELINETWIMGRKTQESKIFAEFELNSPLDLENFSINSRGVVSKFCYWQYRGQGCRYNGLPIEKDDGSPFLDADGNAVIPNYEKIENSPVDFFFDPSAKWDATRTYPKSGVVWVESPSITIPPIQDVSYNTNEAGVPLKTVYVSIKDGNLNQHPEQNPSYWVKDGCTKKLNACNKRFGKQDTADFVGGEVETKTFDTVMLSGTRSNTNAKVPDHTGLFHTHSTAITGAIQPTGEWTILGWVNVNENSAIGAGVFSTSQRDDGSWPACRYLNIGRTRDGSAQTRVEAYHMGYLINKTTSNRNSNAYRIPYLHNLEELNASDDNVAEWHCYIITHTTGTATFVNGQGNEQDTIINFMVDGEMVARNVHDNGRFMNNLGNFASYSERTGMTWDGGTGALPQTFMLGAVELSYQTRGYEDGDPKYTSSMNGQLGTWAVWNRALQENEMNALRRRVIRPNDVDAQLEFVPLKYNECTGQLSTLTGGTGDGLPEGSAPLTWGQDSLVAWWDGTTGIVDGGSTLGMMDIHTAGPYHLTGSGEFEAVQENYSEGELTRISNPTPNNPRFGGFPGTDGFSYGRNTSY